MYEIVGASDSVLRKVVKEVTIWPDVLHEYKYVLQAHFRGRSVHFDYRLQWKKAWLAGWTLNLPGVSKGPKDLDDAKKLVREEVMPKAMEILTASTKKFQMEEKPYEPVAWIDFEGVVPPGEVGATKNWPGVFVICDKGTFKPGIQKEYFKEYWNDSKLQVMPSRFVARLLKFENWIWLGSNSDPEMPYILYGDHLIDSDLPPYGISCLSDKMEANIKIEWWKEKDDKKRWSLIQEARDTL